MSTEHTFLKNTTLAGDSNTTNEMVIGKINTYQRTFLIVAGSLLALLVLVAVAGTNGDQHLQSSVHELAGGAVALADYQVDSANLALSTDMFGLGAVSENDESCFAFAGTGGCHDYTKEKPCRCPNDISGLDCHACGNCYCCTGKYCAIGFGCTPCSF